MKVASQFIVKIEYMCKVKFLDTLSESELYKIINNHWYRVGIGPAGLNRTALEGKKPGRNRIFVSSSM